MTMQEGLYVSRDRMQVTIQTDQGNTNFWVPKAEWDNDGVAAALQTFVQGQTFVQFDATPPPAGKSGPWRLKKIWATQGPHNVPPMTPPVGSSVASAVDPAVVAAQAALDKAKREAAAKAEATREPHKPDEYARPKTPEEQEAMFIMAVVGRAAGSGQLQPTDLKIWTLAAIEAWRSRIVGITPGHGLPEQSGPPDIDPAAGDGPGEADRWPGPDV